MQTSQLNRLVKRLFFKNILKTKRKLLNIFLRYTALRQAFRFLKLFGKFSKGFPELEGKDQMFVFVGTKSLGLLTYIRENTVWGDGTVKVKKKRICSLRYFGLGLQEFTVPLLFVLIPTESSKNFRVTLTMWVCLPEVEKSGFSEHL